MMKWPVVFSIVLASVLAVGLSKSFHQSNDKIIDLITRHGYSTDITVVTTEDGYMSDLIRVCRKNQTSQELKRPVLLMHGLMSSPEDFVYGGRIQGMAFFLADKGHDVYMGSSRGSIYGQRHTTLNPAKDEAFWRFCWEDIGTKDLPAIIDKVLEISGKDKIRFIGHMEGATAFYVLTSKMPEYNDKIERMIAMGPITSMKKSTHPILKKIAENYNSRAWIIKNLGLSRFKPSPELLADVQAKCENMHESKEICSNSYFLFNGYNSLNLNTTTLKEVLPRVPSGGSVREILHWAQLSKSGRFEEFNDGRTKINGFDLSKVTVPMAILSARHDQFSNVEDVEWLMTKLGHVYRREIFNNLNTNLEMLYANNIDKVLYESLEEILDQNVSDKNM